MDFARVEAEFARLKAQFETGAVTEAEFRAQLEELIFEDEQGRWWILGYETGQWYVHDGEQWVQQEPPRAAPGTRPTRLQHPRATDLIPEALSRPALGLKLGRDGVSVLLITAGWLVCLVGISIAGYAWGLMPFGGIGGLITGLVFRRTDPPSPWKQLPVVGIGWALGWALGGAIGFGYMIQGATAGLVGGLITALALKWAHPSILWKQVALVTLGWGIGWAVGGSVGWSLRPPAIWGIPNILTWALWGGIGGAVGSWVTFWQLREATQRAP